MSNRLQQSQWDFEGKSNQPTGRTIYRVSELNRKVKALLQNQFEGVWVEGEVTGLRQQSSGHVYFAIKDDKGQLNCLISLFNFTISVPPSPAEGQKERFSWLALNLSKLISSG